MTELAFAVETIARWRADPVAYARECIHFEPDEWQVEVLQAYADDPVVNPNGLDRICLKASKGPGKSTILAIIIWHFLTCYPHAKVVCTSITGDNLKDGLWTELAKWQNQSPFLKAAFRWNKERISAKDHFETWWCSARTWPKDADASSQADTLAGIHADYVLIVADESGGIPDAVIAAAEGGLANADKTAGRIAKLIIAGNPTNLDGPLYRACTRERHLWWIKEISGDPDDPKRAPRVSIDWARAQIAKYGRDNPWVLVNVFGKFPPGQANTLLGVEDVEAAARRTLHEGDYIHAAKVLGVDVARFGDDRTVIFPRQGRVAFEPKVLRNLDTMQVAGQVVWAITHFKPDAVFIDQTGVGAGVVDRLRELGHNVVGVDSASSPTRSEPKFVNRRDEMWWVMSEWVKGGGTTPDISELLSEMVAPTYSFQNGAYKLEKKSDIKKRLGWSPDLADALALTFALPVVAKSDLQKAAEAAVGVSSSMAIHEYNPLERG